MRCGSIDRLIYSATAIRIATFVLLQLGPCASTPVNVSSVFKVVLSFGSSSTDWALSTEESAVMKLSDLPRFILPLSLRLVWRWISQAFFPPPHVHLLKRIKRCGGFTDHPLREMKHRGKLTREKRPAAAKTNTYLLKATLGHNY